MKRDRQLPEWWYDELEPTGVDYTSIEEVERYDSRHQRFRDYEKESKAIINLLGFGRESTVIDFGAGTGAFTLHAARACRTVYAVDISEVMLACCKRKSEEVGLQNIVFCHGGFLTYEHEAEPVDAIVSTIALHHLPDFWKLIGLKRIARMLKRDGRFFLFDVVFPSAAEDLEYQIDSWIGSMSDESCSELSAEAAIHIQKEYSTYDWVMEGLLERAGFEIDFSEYSDGMFARYICKLI